MIKRATKQKKRWSEGGVLWSCIREALRISPGLNLSALFFITLSIATLLSQSLGSGQPEIAFQRERVISSPPLSVMQESEKVAPVGMLIPAGKSVLAPTFIKAQNYLAIKNSTLFATNETSLEVYNISEPQAPTSIKYSFDCFFTGKILIIDNFLFCAVKQSTPNAPYSLNIYGCSNITNLSLIKSYPQAAKIYHFGLYRNHLFILSNEMLIYNLSANNSMEVFWSWDGNQSLLSDFTISGGTLFLLSTVFLYSFSLGNFLSEPLFLQAFNGTSLQDEHSLSYLGSQMVLLAPSTLGIFNVVEPEVLLFNVSNPLNITLQRTCSLDFRDEIYISYFAPFAFMYGNDQLNIYRFTAFEGSVSFYRISHFRDPLNEKLKKKFPVINYCRFCGVALKDGTLFLWRYIYTPERFIFYCLDFSSPLDVPVLLFRSTFTDTLLLYAYIVKGILLLIPGLVGVFLVAQGISWAKHKKASQQESEGVREETKEETHKMSELGRVHNNLRLLKIEKTFLVGSTLFLCFYILKVIFEWQILIFFAESTSKYLNGGNVGLFYSISQYFDLSAALLFAGSFLGVALIERKWKFLGISFLWLAWFGTTLCFRLLWGFPYYQYLFAFSENSPYPLPSYTWLYASQASFIFYSISIVLFGCCIFSLQEMLVTRRTKRLMLLTAFVIIYWLFDVISFYEHFSYIQYEIFNISRAISFDQPLISEIFIPGKLLLLLFIVPLGISNFTTLIIDLCQSIRGIKKKEGLRSPTLQKHKTEMK